MCSVTVPDHIGDKSMDQKHEVTSIFKLYHVNVFNSIFPVTHILIVEIKNPQSGILRVSNTHTKDQAA